MRAPVRLAVANSAVRETANADVFLDRIRVQTGIDVEVIDGSEESRLMYLAVALPLRFLLCTAFLECLAEGDIRTSVTH